MTDVPLRDIVEHLDELLSVAKTPDYDTALNGLQVDHRGPVKKLAAAVDCSRRTIQAAIEADANLLLVHHGLFWGGLQPLTGPFYERVRLLLDHDVAVYSAHLPLDIHEIHGNSRLLADALGLKPVAGFARHETLFCGVRGLDDVDTSALHARVQEFSRIRGGAAIASAISPGRRTRHWAICSGAGANLSSIREAVELGVDTLIVGEGPHWSSVEAEEKGLVIIYGGHYATETLGVRSLVATAAERFGLPWTFIEAPTGL